MGLRRSTSFGPPYRPASRYQAWLSACRFGMYQRHVDAIVGDASKQPKWAPIWSDWKNPLPAGATELPHDGEPAFINTTIGIPWTDADGQVFATPDGTAMADAIGAAGFKVYPYQQRMMDAVQRGDSLVFNPTSRRRSMS